ncbi:MAG: gamma-glutamyl-phosphate reductase, partial [Candidatus Nanopelagicaceae bacterium]
MEATAMIAELADKARLAARTLIAASDADRVEALNRIADELSSSEVEILAANAKDMENAVKDGMAESMQDRLLLTEARVH